MFCFYRVAGDHYEGEGHWVEASMVIDLAGDRCRVQRADQRIKRAAPIPIGGGSDFGVQESFGSRFSAAHGE